MAGFECLECGEKATYLHPKYSDGVHSHSSHLCGPCLIFCLEELYDEAVDNLREAVAETNEASITLSFIDAVEARK